MELSTLYLWRRLKRVLYNKLGLTCAHKIVHFILYTVIICKTLKTIYEDISRPGNCFPHFKLREDIRNATSNYSRLERFLILTKINLKKRNIYRNFNDCQTTSSKQIYIIYGIKNRIQQKNFQIKSTSFKIRSVVCNFFLCKNKI